MASKHIRNILFGMVVLAYIYYGLQYIQKSAITVNNQTYYILFDDAMISMRYAYNLVHGQGLVWNAGEYVEGYTNPLWVGYMALFHLLPIPIHTIGLYIQLSGLFFLVLTLFFVRKIVEEFTDNIFVMLGAVALTAFYNPLNIWALLGMEVSILTLIVMAVIWIALHNSSRFTPWIYILLAVSTLFRIDMLVPYLAILTVLFFGQPQYSRQHLTWGLGLLILFLGGQTLARYFYYGELLPNTYYLKVTGWPISLRILRGLYALIWFTYFINWAFALLPFTLLVFRRDWKILLLFAVLASQVAYSVYVGGDAWENHGGANRYIAIAMPPFFILFALAVQELLDRAVKSLGSGRATFIGSCLIFLVIFSIAMINFNLLLGDWKYIERWQLRRLPDYVAGNERNVNIALALRPGHMKWNYAHTFGERKPDVIVSLWDETGKEAEPYLHDYVLAQVGKQTSVFVRKDSPKILWDKITLAD
jgi:hypothetical protein